MKSVFAMLLILGGCSKPLALNPDYIEKPLPRIADMRVGDAGNSCAVYVNQNGNLKIWLKGKVVLSPSCFGIRRDADGFAVIVDRDSRHEVSHYSTAFDMIDTTDPVRVEYK